MNEQPLEQVVRNIDARLERVERILPTLATRAELHHAKSELREAIKEAVAPLATRAELRSEIREEGERTRRHFDVVAEQMHSDVRLVAEGHMSRKRDSIARSRRTRSSTRNSIGG